MLKRAWPGVCWLALWLAGPVSAAQLVVHVVDAKGHAVSDAVVTLTPESKTTTPSPPRPSRTYFIDQKDETFIPYVEIFRPGDKVVFRNSDTTRHQVYSFSKVKKFELLLRPGESSPAMTLANSGIAAVGCNIHDNMVTYLYVSPTDDVALSDNEGIARMDHLAKGSYTLTLWHPQLHPGRDEPKRRITISGQADIARLSFTLSLIPDPRGASGHDSTLY